MPTTFKYGGNTPQANEAAGSIRDAISPNAEQTPKPEKDPNEDEQSFMQRLQDWWHKIYGASAGEANFNKPGGIKQLDDKGKQSQQQSGQNNRAEMLKKLRSKNPLDQEDTEEEGANDVELT